MTCDPAFDIEVADSLRRAFRLAPREAAVLALLLDGVGGAEALRLGAGVASPAALRKQVTRIRKKLPRGGVGSKKRPTRYWLSAAAVEVCRAFLKRLNREERGESRARAGDLRARQRAVEFNHGVSSACSCGSCGSCSNLAALDAARTAERFKHEPHEPHERTASGATDETIAREARPFQPAQAGETGSASSFPSRLRGRSFFPSPSSTEPSR